MVGSYWLAFIHYKSVAVVGSYWSVFIHCIFIMICLHCGGLLLISVYPYPLWYAFAVVCSCRSVFIHDISIMICLRCGGFLSISVYPWYIHYDMASLWWVPIDQCLSIIYPLWYAFAVVGSYWSVFIHYISIMICLRCGGFLSISVYPWYIHYDMSSLWLVPIDKCLSIINRLQLFT